MTEITKSTLKTLGFYGAVAISVFILDFIKPESAHIPGLGILFLVFILPVFSGLLLIANVISYFNNNKTVLYSIIIHSVVVLIAILLHSI